MPNDDSDVQRETTDHEDGGDSKYQAVEIVPQYNSYKARNSTLNQANLDRRRSEIVNNQNNDGIKVYNQKTLLGDDSSFQVSHIEHVKRDEILDDSLLFALGHDGEAKDLAPHLDDDTEDEGNRADLEMVDHHFFDR